MSRSARTSAKAISLADARRAVVEKRLRAGAAFGPTAASEAPVRQTDGPAPLSDAQRGIWFLQRIAPNTPLFNECYTILLPEALDPLALAESLTEIARRHAIWRTTFELVDGEPRQIIHPPTPVEITAIDLRAYDGPVERTAEAVRIASEDAARPFDLARGPLVRAILISLSDVEHRLFLTVHHLVIDSVTVYEVLLPELAQIYDKLIRGQRPDLPLPPIQYADYAHWREQRTRSSQLLERLAYWKNLLSDAPLGVTLPADRPRPFRRTFIGGRQQLVLSSDLTSRIYAAARAEGATPFVVLLTVLVALLHDLTGQEDIVVGAPVTAPRPPACAGLIGLFANTVALRVDASGNPSFRALLARVRSAMVDAIDHADVPFDRVVKEVRPGSTLSHAPIFQTVLALQNAPPPIVAAYGFGVTPLEADSGGSKVDVALLLDERVTAGPSGEAQNCLGATMQYSADLFDASTMARRLEEFATLADNASRHPERRLSDLSCISHDVRRRMVEEWNATTVAYPGNLAIHALFEAQVATAPEAIAIETANGQVSYRELDARATALASVLRRLGVGPETRVGVLLDRSAAFVTCLLAILKAGGAYVPLDPRAPHDRLSWTLADAHPRVLLTEGRALDASLPPDTMIVRLDDACRTASGPEDAALPDVPVIGDSLACVLYTSGSTGQPKGVAITHRNIVRLVMNSGYVTLGPGDRVAHAASVCFDAASFEIWGALLSGATLVIIPDKAVLSPRALADTIAERGLTTMFLTTAVFNQMAREHPTAFARMRDVLFGGEVADPEAVRRVLDSGPPERLLNMYGPTEATTFASWHQIEPGETLTGGVPIGRPIANTTLYVLDKYLVLVPVGVQGELFIGGDGVAREYLNCPELTAERFIPDPFSATPGARLYRTGDLARYRTDGVIEFAGRIDHQVKLRGFRIEPGEIESAMVQHPDVNECVVSVCASPAGEKLLAAHVRLNPLSPLATRPDLAPTALRAFLKIRLPDYMVPSAIVVIDRWPLTSVGKVDRDALTAVPLHATKSDRAVPARDRLESELIRLWSDLLNVSSIGIDESFFDLGGHSLLAARMIDEVGRLCGRELPLAGFFANPTIASLAQAVEDLSETVTPALVTLRRDGAKAPFFFVHGDFNGRGLYCRHLLRAVETDRPFHLIHPHGIDGRQIPPTIEAMAEDHLRAVRGLRPHGPYVIGGYCNGALVAFAMAQQLVADGEQIERLILVDPPPAGIAVGRLQRGVAAAYAWLTGDARRALDGVLRIRAFGDLTLADQVRTLSGKLHGAFGNGRDDDVTHVSSVADPTHDYSLVIGLYTPQVYRGRVALILAEAADPRIADAWRRLSEEIELVPTSGNHMNCTTTYAPFLAQRIRAILNASDLRPPGGRRTAS